MGKRAPRKATRKATPGSDKGKAGAAYAAHRQAMLRKSRREAAEGQDIGLAPPIVNMDRRIEASASFQRFCELYHPATFYLPWSADHLKVIGRIQEAVDSGGLYAMAMPRGGGKTSLCIAGAEWAVLRGSHRFVALIEANDSAARESLESIKTDFEVNDFLLEDFPEVIYAIRCLERTANRCKTQRCNHTHTRIEWTADTIVMPSIAASAMDPSTPPENGCAAIIQATGLLGRVRGMWHARPDGSKARPDFVVVNDPQTDASAGSITETRKRLGILTGAVLKLGGPDRQISGFMPCTVIKPGDMADQILDREIHPEWRGERMRMLYALPTREDLWEQYAELYRAGLKQGSTTAATEFYQGKQATMDEGSIVAWPERFKGDFGEVSGLQHAMNWKIQDEASFWAECQNEPQPEDEEENDMMTADEIAAKLNNRPRGQVPGSCNRLTAFIDVGQKVLFWMVCAWENTFTGYVLDYGVYPEQKQTHFNTRNVMRTLGRAHPGTGAEGAIYAGLKELTGQILGREWKREDGAMLHIEQCLVDQGWKTSVVHQFCRESPFAALILPSRGSGITAAMRPIAEYDRKRGDHIGESWWVPSVKGKRVLRHIEIDTNWWKTFVHDRLRTAMGDKGCLSLFGDKPLLHRLLAEHLTAERNVKTEGRGRRVDEWALPPNKPDNHYLDCLVGCAAAASYRGVTLSGMVTGREPAGRKKVSLAEMQRQRRGDRKRDQRSALDYMYGRTRK